jgi:transcriptional regulator
MDQGEPPPSRDHEQDARIAAMRDSGVAWHEIRARFGLTRQQVRYAYQRAKREERRAQRKLT